MKPIAAYLLFQLYCFLYVCVYNALVYNWNGSECLLMGLLLIYPLKELVEEI